MKNKFKRFSALLLCIVLSVTLTACGSSGAYYRLESALLSRDNVITAEDGTVSFYVNGTEKTAEKFDNNYYIDGKNILPENIRGYMICFVDGLTYLLI